jgi:hypothetical protein
MRWIWVMCSRTEPAVAKVPLGRHGPGPAGTRVFDTETYQITQSHLNRHNTPSPDMQTLQASARHDAPENWLGAMTQTKFELRSCRPRTVAGALPTRRSPRQLLATLPVMPPYPRPKPNGHMRGGEGHSQIANDGSVSAAAKGPPLAAIFLGPRAAKAASRASLPGWGARHLRISR